MVRSDSAVSRNLHLQALPQHVVRPALAAAGEVLAMGDQALMQLTGEQRDAVDPGVVAESNSRTCRPGDYGWSGVRPDPTRASPRTPLGARAPDGRAGPAAWQPQQAYIRTSDRSALAPGRRIDPSRGPTTGGPQTGEARDKPTQGGSSHLRGTAHHGLRLASSKVLVVNQKPVIGVTRASRAAI